MFNLLKLFSLPVNTGVAKKNVLGWPHWVAYRIRHE